MHPIRERQSTGEFGKESSNTLRHVRSQRMRVHTFRAEIITRPWAINDFSHKAYQQLCDLHCLKRLRIEYPHNERCPNELKELLGSWNVSFHARSKSNYTIVQAFEILVLDIC